jgi:hypothetical protein
MHPVHYHGEVEGQRTEGLKKIGVGRYDVVYLALHSAGPIQSGLDVPNSRV